MVQPVNQEPSQKNDSLRSHTFSIGHGLSRPHVYNRYRALQKKSRNRKHSSNSAHVNLVSPVLLWWAREMFYCFYHWHQAESERPLGKRSCLLKWSQLPKINWVFLSCALFSSSLASSFWHGVHSGLGRSLVLPNKHTGNGYLLSV